MSAPFLLTVALSGRPLSVPLVGALAGLGTAFAWGLADVVTRAIVRERAILSEARRLLWLPLASAVAATIWLSAPLALLGVQTSRATWIALAPLLLLMAALLAIGNLALAVAFARGSLALTSPIANANALVTALLAVALTGERTSAVEGLGMGFALLGCALVSWRRAPSRRDLPAPAPAPARIWLAWSAPYSGELWLGRTRSHLSDPRRFAGAMEAGVQSLAEADAEADDVAPHVSERVSAEGSSRSSRSIFAAWSAVPAARWAPASLPPLIQGAPIAPRSHVLRLHAAPTGYRLSRRIPPGLPAAIVAMLSLGVAYWLARYLTAAGRGLEIAWSLRLLMALLFLLALLGAALTSQRISPLSREFAILDPRSDLRRALAWGSADPSRRCAALIAAVCALGALDAIATSSFLAGVAVAGVAPVAASGSMSAAVAVVGASLWLGERPGGPQWLGVVLSVAGLLLLALG